MALERPLFSILIPTRGRTQEVAWAIQSALAQTFSDLECVVIDNNLDDRVEKICAQFDDPRLRHVKTGGLNMPDNWEQAYLNARGTFALLMEDRQAFYGHVLEYINRLCQREKVDCLLWHYDGFDEKAVPARVRRSGGDRTLRRIRSDDVLEGIYGRNPDYDPKQLIMSHFCAVRVDLLNKIREQTGTKLCEPTSPDLTAGLKILNELDSFHYFNGAFSVRHSDRLSNGVNFHQKKESANDFWESVGGKATSYSHTPVKACFTENLGFNEYLRLTEVLGGRLRAHPIDWVYYYTTLGAALFKDSEAGLDRIEELTAWRSALAAEPDPIRRKVKANLSKRDRRQFMQKLRVRLGIRDLERMLRKKKVPKPSYEETPFSLPDFVAAETLRLSKCDLAG